jgi:hypothetical protein
MIDDNYMLLPIVHYFFNSFPDLDKEKFLNRKLKNNLSVKDLLTLNAKFVLISAKVDIIINISSLSPLSPSYNNDIIFFILIMVILESHNYYLLAIL